MTPYELAYRGTSSSNENRTLDAGDAEDMGREEGSGAVANVIGEMGESEACDGTRELEDEISVAGVGG